MRSLHDVHITFCTFKIISRRTSSFTYKSVADTHVDQAQNIPPSQKRKEREHPFNDGKRVFRNNGGSSKNVIPTAGQTPNQLMANNNHTPTPITPNDHRCHCSAGVQKYCLQEKSPYCVCTYNKNGDSNDKPCCPQNPKVVEKHGGDGGGVPIGSKLYTNGERSQNRNRDKHRDCVDGTLGQTNPSNYKPTGAGRRSIDRDTQRPPAATNVQPPESPSSEMTVLQPHNNSNAVNSLKGRGMSRKEQSIEPLSRIGTSASLDTVAQDPFLTNKSSARKAERQATRESLRTMNIWSSDEVSSSRSQYITENSYGYGKLLWWLLILLILWLTLLTIFIFNPGSIGLLSMAKLKLEECADIMYTEVRP